MQSPFLIQVRNAAGYLLIFLPARFRGIDVVGEYSRIRERKNLLGGPPVVQLYVLPWLTSILRLCRCLVPVYEITCFSFGALIPERSSALFRIALYRSLFPIRSRI